RAGGRAPGAGTLRPVRGSLVDARVERGVAAGASPAAGIVPEHLLDFEPRELLRAVPGRETFAWPPDAPRWVVKRFHEAGGAIARALRRTRASPARREHENLVALAALGLCVPRAAGWCQREAADERVSLVVMERVEHQRTLRETLAGASG